MKIKGGFTPKIAGRPSSIVDEFPESKELTIDLVRRGLNYTPVVKENQQVDFGRPLAEVSVEGGTLSLPAPASGRIEAVDDSKVKIRVSSVEVTASLNQLRPERARSSIIREALAQGGIWPFFWSSQTRSAPSLTEKERPRAVIVNFVVTEPFRTRGKAILSRSWELIVQGMRFLPRLMDDYGKIEIIVTAVRDPVARMMYSDLAGHAWIRFHPVPLRYPVENPLILDHALRQIDPSLKSDDVIWVMDAQAIEALGACLVRGIPLHRRILAAGGPGLYNPKHINMRVGTPIRYLLDRETGFRRSLILRGGIMTGEPIDPEEDAVQYDDDALFFLPEMEEREFLSFLRPGFDRTSALPSFVSRATGALDGNITTSLRGECRPCIVCGVCEKVCPARLMPQVLHRYLYRDALDEAEKAGLNLCVYCNLCTFVCPSKIELHAQFRQARDLLVSEAAEEG